MRNIRTSGTVTPSSGYLIHRLVRGIDFQRARVIVELGVGDGCVTRELLARMRPDARLISLEINPGFAVDARTLADPRLDLRHACATALPGILEGEGIRAVDAVVSSLPLAIMDQEVVDRILDASRDCLAPAGKFLQYQYSLSQRARLRSRFRHVAVGLTLLNVPPGFVYECSQAPQRASRRRPLPKVAARCLAAALAGVALVVRAYQAL